MRLRRNERLRNFLHRRTRGLRMEPLESRTLLSATPTDDSFRLAIFTDSTEVDIPAEVGVAADDSTQALFTIDDSGEIYMESPTGNELGDFFDIWQNNAGLAGNRADAMLTEDQLMANIEDGANTVQMFVNGQVSKDFEDYAVQDGDEIVLVYGDNPVLSLNTNYGPIVLELFEGATPGTVNNFLNYVNDGDYENSFFHRSVENFVIQAGGFTTPSTTFTDTDQFSEVPADAPIQNEPGISNVRATVAMAKLGGDPDSATNQFFVNLTDNSSNLDNQNGGFTVFGQVLDMATADEIADLPITPASTIDDTISNSDASLYSSLPLGDGNELAVIQSIDGQGTISGRKYRDENRNGDYDEGEELLAGATVYLDANDNGVLDSGETWEVTGSDGSFRFQVEAGEYTVRSEVTPGRVGTEPVAPDAYETTVQIGRETTGLDFGEADLAAPTGVDLLAASDTGAADDDDLTQKNNSDQASTLQFLVSGVTEGAEVQIFADGALIGSEIATGETVIVTTDGVHTLSDGLHSITAVQAFGGTTDPSDPLEVTIDTTPPGGLTNEAPNIAAVGELYAFDADSPDEGEVAYSLDGAPDGMTVDAATGEIAWTPGGDQAVPHTFDVVITDEAGNSTSQAISLTVLGDIPAYPDEHYSVDEDGVLSVDAAGGVLENDDTTSGTLSVAVHDLPQHGNLTLHSDGSFTYEPFANYSGTDTFTYVATNDADEESNVAPVTITVNPVNDAPVGADDAYTLNEDAVLTRTVASGVLANDTDAEGDELTATLVDQAAHGTVTLAADGSFTYTPEAEYHGDDSFTYQVNDGTDESGEITVSLTITSVNDAPVTEPDSYEIDEDGTLTAGVADGVLNNDSDEDSEDFAAMIESEPSHGEVTLDSNGSFVYTPEADFFGTDTFTYVASDGDVTSAETTVTITVNATADDPTAADDTSTAPNDGTSVLIDVLDNDTFEPDDEQTLTITAVTQGSAGGTVAIEDGQIRYTGKEGATGEETFTYTITDADGLTDTATVTVDVVDAAENTLSGYVYVDSDGDGARGEGEMGVPGVLITLTGTDNFGNAVTRTALTSNDGSYAFEELLSGVYRLSERQPTALADAEESSAVAGAVIGEDVISNLEISDSGVFGDNNFGEAGLLPEYISIKMFFASAPPMEECVRDMVALGEEKAGYPELAQAIRNGDTTFDSEDNDAPLAADDAYSMDEDGTLTIAASSGVLSNDTDVDGDALSAAVVADAAHGSLTFNGDGSFSYVPDEDFHGSDTFTYLVNDGLEDSGVATVTITVNPVNDAPEAEGDAYDVTEDGTLTVDADEGVLANDEDPDGDDMTVGVVSDVENGTLTLEDDGSFTYTPDGGFRGTDTFTYAANDGTADSEAATVTIHVNARPDADDDDYSTDEDQELTVAADEGVLANDSDADGDALTVAVTAEPSHGTLDLDDDGSFSYTPDADFHGTDSFTYTANDGSHDSAEATVTIIVVPVNDLPEATDDAYAAAAGTTLKVDAEEGVLANDTDADGDELTATLVSDVENGTLTLEGDGSFTYTPNSGFLGEDAFTYTVDDGTGDSEEATVTIHVNARPEADDDEYSTDEDQELTVEADEGVLANDSDADGDALTVSVAAEPSHGTLDLGDDGSFTYTPDADFHGTDTFSYRVSDGTHESAEATVTITVDAVEDAPVAAEDSYSVDEDGVLAIDAATGLLDNDSDADGDTLAVTDVTAPSHGTLTVEENGSFTYTPDADFHGTDTFTYKATDGANDSAVTTVTVTVDPVNDEPVVEDDSYAVEPNTLLTVDAASGVLANDSDADGDSLTITLVTGPAHGTVLMNEDGSFNYTPDDEFEGSDSFTYSVNDGTVESAVATVTLDVDTEAALADQALAEEEDWA